MFTQGHVTLMVADLDRAITFYTRTLGLEMGDRWGDDYAVVRGPGMEIGLHPGRIEGDEGGPYCLSLGTQDLAATVATLESRGITFPGPITDDGPRRAINFHDPDGHPVHLREDWSPEQPEVNPA